MSQVSRAIERIAAAAESEGLPRFAERSGVPYTTVFEWAKRGWRPKAVLTLEKLAATAEATAANEEGERSPPTP